MGPSFTCPYALRVIQHIDLLTAKKEDLTFDAPFSLTCTRNDCKDDSLYTTSVKF